MQGVFSASEKKTILKDELRTFLPIYYYANTFFWRIAIHSAFLSAEEKGGKKNNF